MPGSGSFHSVARQRLGTSCSKHRQPLAFGQCSKSFPTLRARSLNASDRGDRFSGILAGSGSWIWRWQMSLMESSGVKKYHQYGTMGCFCKSKLEIFGSQIFHKRDVGPRMSSEYSLQTALPCSAFMNPTQSMDLFPIDLKDESNTVCRNICVDIYLHACMHAYIHPCMHTYIHTYLHTYIHTCMPVPYRERERERERDIHTCFIYHLFIFKPLATMPYNTSYVYICIKHIQVDHFRALASGSSSKLCLAVFAKGRDDPMGRGEWWGYIYIYMMNVCWFIFALIFAFLIVSKSKLMLETFVVSMG